jgi:hypothetical protein
MKRAKPRGLIFAYKGLYWPAGKIDLPGCQLKSAALTTTMTGCGRPMSRFFCGDRTRMLRFVPNKKGEPSPFDLPVKQLATAVDAVAEMDFLRTAVDELLKKRR